MTGGGARQRTLAQRDARFGQLLLTPTLLVVVVVVVLPILWTFVLAFQDLRVIELRRKGLFGSFTVDNFTAVVTSPGFWTALRTTLLFSVVGTAGSIGVGLAAALALRRGFRGRTFVYVGDYNPSLQLAFDRADPPVEVIASDGGIPIAEWKVWVLRGFKGFPDTGWARKAY